MRICAYRSCPWWFEPARKDQLYHTPECRRAAKRERDRMRSGAADGIPAATVRALNVGAVAADLARRGWAVYAAYSEAMPFDVLAFRGDHSLRLMVRTGYLRRGRLYCPSAPDVPGVTVAIVTEDGTLDYRPPLPLRIGELR